MAHSWSAAVLSLMVIIFAAVFFWAAVIVLPATWSCQSSVARMSIFTMLAVLNRSEPLTSSCRPVTRSSTATAARPPAPSR